MLRILSSLLNKAHSGEVHLINTVPVYHARSIVYMTPKSTRVSARLYSFYAYRSRLSTQSFVYVMRSHYAKVLDPVFLIVYVIR